MTLGSAPYSAEAERAELETVVAAFERSPRLAKLLSFVGQKYLDGHSGDITEYNIATEVFGRAKTSFDSTDSVARRRCIASEKSSRSITTRREKIILYRF